MTTKAGTLRLPRSVTFLAGLSGFLLVGALLYWAKAILIPIALAVLLTFLLSLPVMRLQRLGVPKAVAVLLVVGLSLSLVAAVGWLVATQVVTLAEELPDHYGKIKDKLRDVKALQKGGVFEEVGRLFARASEQAEEEVRQAAEARGEETGEEEVLWGFGPIPVRVLAEETVIPQTFGAILAPLVEPLATAGLVVVLVLFMLLKREDLRNRIVTLSGRA
ncbi:MAG TPA: AI-2E family transporter, partial [Planctomycetaceae bacterium]